MNRLRGKFTYSNVMVTVLAVLVVGGGTAYAASQMLPKNSVGTRQIKNHAVTPAKLSRSAVNSLQGARGAQGAQGPKGARGATGAKGVTGAQGQAGPKGDTGAAGEDAGPAYLSLGTEEAVVFPPGADHEVKVIAIKNLPAGTYVVSFTGDLFNANATKAVQVQCGLISNPEDGNLVLVGGIYTLRPRTDAGLSSTATVSQESTVRYTSDGGEIFATCTVIEGEAEEGEFGHGRVGIGLQRMVATKVTGVSIQEFEVTGGSPTTLR
ncbi:MAG TPA: collagen-like protein [Solirubrobacterales bacterium]|jgi:hypothetical protein|nr:collagen-like protein [Solirubrobacterales bacterium]